MRPMALAVACACACASSPPAPAGPALHLTLPAHGGGVIDFAALRGKPTLVHIFTTWSVPATDDAERLRQLDARTDALNIVGVALDDGSVPGALTAWRRATGIEYPVAVATPAVRAGRSVLGSTRQVPVSLLYDARGALVRRWEQALGEAGIAEIEREIERGAGN